MVTELVTINNQRNVTLTAYIQGCGPEFPNISKRPAVLILPGGGYEFCSEREADPVAFPYLAAGFQVFILRYSLKELAKWPNPIIDYETAMNYIRKNAEKWMVIPDKIALIGFSAGGHLAAAATAMSRNKPNATILGYPLTGPDTKQWLETAPDVVPFVDDSCPPVFVFATRTDALVPVANSIRFVDALEKAGVPFECHIYSFGNHGFSTADSSVTSDFSPITSRANNWVQDSIGWLREVLGDFGPDGVGAPTCPRK